MSPPRALKPALLSRVPRGRSMVVEASAGTGKTYTLVHWIVALLLEEAVPIEEILVLTFTVKAAGELRERVRGLLRELLTKPRTAPDGAPAFVLDDAARERLRQAERGLDAATITTIHAFCQGVLTETGFLAGRLLSQELAPTRPLAERAYREVLRRTVLPDDTLRELYFAAGTADSVERAALLMLQHRVPLVPTWDEARFALALRPVADLVGRGDVGARLEGLHASTRRAWEGVLEALAGAATEPPHRALPIVHERLASLVGKDTFSSVRAGTAAAHTQRLLADLAAVTPSPRIVLLASIQGTLRARFAAEKQARGVVDFDDLLLAVRDALEGERGHLVQDQLRRRYRFALIDEFQDTDDVQWAIFRRVFVESREPRPAYLIGDPKQAIYSFRGADVATYLAARKHILGRGDPLRLEECFRATPGLIGVYNRIFAEAGFFGDAIAYTEVRAGKESLRLTRADGAPAPAVVALEVDGDAALAEAIASEVARILGPEPLVLGEPGQEAKVRAGDIFILVRNRGGAAGVGRALRARGVPYTFYRQTGLYQSDEAAELLAMLLAVASPDDDARRAAAYLTRFFSVPLGAVERLQESASRELERRLYELHQLARARRYEELFSALFEHTGVVRREIALAGSERGITNFLHLGEILLAFALRTRCTVEDLVDHLRSLMKASDNSELYEEDEQRLETDRDAVQLLTMHVSKGLEAKVVFLAQVQGTKRADLLSLVPTPDGRALTHEPLEPTLREGIKRAAEEEERRLLYVAITRAKGRLYLPLLAKASDVYKPVQEVVARLAAGEVPDVRGEVERRAHTRSAVAPASARPAGAAALATFTPPPSLSVPAALPAGWLHAHEAPRLVSYTSLKRHESSRDAPLAPDEDRPEDESAPPRRPGEGELPAGAEAGVCVHAILEEVDLAPLAAGADLAGWQGDETTVALVTRALDAHRMPRSAAPQVMRMVHGALTMPLGSPTGPVVARARRVRRETELLFPIPELAYPAFGAVLPGAPELEVTRGYVRGILDVVLEDDGRVYFVDWKTDLLPRYDAASVAAHAEASYGLQALLYTLGLLRLLRVSSEADYEARFGGYFYVFLRGLEEAGGEAVYAARPTFATVTRWEERLRGPLQAWSATP